MRILNISTLIISIVVWLYPSRFSHSFIDITKICHFNVRYERDRSIYVNMFGKQTGDNFWCYKYPRVPHYQLCIHILFTYILHTAEVVILCSGKCLSSSKISQRRCAYSLQGNILFIRIKP